jgi:hypothetical protein
VADQHLGSTTHHPRRCDRHTALPGSLTGNLPCIVAKDSVILASFENRHAAEHMLASLGRGFRKEARKGHATALVISGNQDGSLKLTQSRVLSASGVVYTVLRISLSVTIGFAGILSSLKGAKGAAHEVRERDSHVGSDELAVHGILGRIGPMRPSSWSLATKHCGRRSWHGRVTVQAKAGTVPVRSSLLASIREMTTTGCGPLWTPDPSHQQAERDQTRWHSMST